MPTYTLPNFNLTCDIYGAVTPPPAGPILWPAVPCQMYINSRMAAYGNGNGNILRIAYNPAIVLIGPQPWAALSGMIINCPIGSASYYEILFADVVHRGFPNQYVEAQLIQLDPAFLPGIRYYSSAPI